MCQRTNERPGMYSCDMIKYRFWICKTKFYKSNCCFSMKNTFHEEETILLSLYHSYEHFLKTILPPLSIFCKIYFFAIIPRPSYPPFHIIIIARVQANALYIYSFPKWARLKLILAFIFDKMEIFKKVSYKS